MQPCKFRHCENTGYANYQAFSCLSRLIYVENRDEIVVTDPDAKVLKVLDAKDNFSFITYINPSKILDCPVSICVNTIGDIFVGDYTHSKVFVFDEFYDFKHSFGEGVIQKAFSMTVDPEKYF